MIAICGYFLFAVIAKLHNFYFFPQSNEKKILIAWLRCHLKLMLIFLSCLNVPWVYVQNWRISHTNIKLPKYLPRLCYHHLNAEMNKKKKELKTATSTTIISFQKTDRASTLLRVRLMSMWESKMFTLFFWRL